MTERSEDLQRQHQGSQTELTLAANNASLARPPWRWKKVDREAVRVQLATVTAGRAAAAAQVAALEERCTQQQETPGYF
ncbi:MAG: hypothetical protein EOO38_09940 [Cytophagaceae bacterium]|nr:MAG: hypothetical protein EOO38_09940 [Cytophagaceae bacterium]